MKAGSINASGADFPWLSTSRYEFTQRHGGTCCTLTTWGPGHSFLYVSKKLDLFCYRGNGALATKFFHGQPYLTMVRPNGGVGKEAGMKFRTQG